MACTARRLLTAQSRFWIRRSAFHNPDHAFQPLHCATCGGSGHGAGIPERDTIADLGPPVAQWLDPTVGVA